MVAEGRTFPVEALFLEDVYQATQYRLPPDASAALRGGAARASAHQMQRQAAGGNRWGPGDIGAVDHAAPSGCKVCPASYT
jgi:hypothetical protein